MVGTLQPLGKGFAIVDEKGQPTDYFIRWAQQRQIDIGEGISLEQAQELVDELGKNEIIAGLGLSGGGPLSDDVTLNLDATLDDLTNVDVADAAQGQVLTFIDGEWVAETAASGGNNSAPTEVGPSGYYAAGSQPRKMWQINVLSNKSGNPGTSIMLAEIQFRTTPGIPQLVGPGFASASSVLGNGFASNAFDNNPGTFWHTNGTSASTITYDYNTPISVQEVMITLRDGGDSVGGSPEVFEVRASDDGLVWEVMWTVVDAEWTTNAQTKVFTNPDIGALTNFYPVKIAALNDVSNNTPTDGQVLVWNASTGEYVPTSGSGGVPEAPSDGNLYGRKNNQWSVVPSGGGGGGGSTRVPWYLGGAPITPAAADFTVYKSSNDFPITLNNEVDGLHLEFGVGGNAGTDRTAVLERPITGSTVDFQALLVGQNNQRNYQNIGVSLRNTGSGRFVTFGIGEARSRGYNILRWNTPGSYAGAYRNDDAPAPAWPLWMRVLANGTEMRFSWSANGKYWTELMSVPFGDFLGSADRVGIHYVASQTQAPQNIVEHLHIMDWRQS